jgi:hypothetical protein
VKVSEEQYSGVRDQEIHAALDRHWAASDANDFETEHRIYHEDAVLEYPQSGERTRRVAAWRPRRPSGAVPIWFRGANGKPLLSYYFFEYIAPIIRPANGR